MSKILVENCHMLSSVLEKQLKKDIINPHDREVLESFSFKVFRLVFKRQAKSDELFCSMIEKVEKGIPINARAYKEYKENPIEFYRKASHYACSVYLYVDPDKTESIVSLMNATKVLIGTINSSSGYSDSPSDSGHVNWWMFRNFKPMNVFSLID